MLGERFGALGTEEQILPLIPQRLKNGIQTVLMRKFERHPVGMLALTATQSFGIL